jgi:hypothetical protein
MTAFQRSYLTLDNPLNQNPFGENSGISALQSLYAGRPMTIWDTPNRYTSIPENPEGAKNTYLNSRMETKEYAHNLEILTRNMGGGDKEKVLSHAVDDPSSMIDNPDLSGNAMQSPLTQNNGQPFLVQPETPSKMPSISENDTFKDRKPLRENFEPVHHGEEVKKNKDNLWKWTDGLLATILLILLIVGIYVSIYAPKYKSRRRS